MSLGSLQSSVLHTWQVAKLGAVQAVNTAMSMDLTSLKPGGWFRGNPGQRRHSEMQLSEQIEQAQSKAVEEVDNELSQSKLQLKDKIQVTDVHTTPHLFS